jgi:DNA modification methylase
MKNIPDKSIDFLVTDAPFGMQGEEKIEDILVRLQEANRVCKNMLILMDYRNFWQVDAIFHDKKIGEIVWEYGWVSGGRTKAKSGFFPTHNTIGLYGDKENFKFLQGSIIHRGKGLSSPRQCSFAKKTGHPYEKPIKLFEVLLSQLNNCNSVLDCFMGSGSTGIACINTNRRFIGIELDEGYFNIAKQRIDEAIKGGANG